MTKYRVAVVGDFDSLMMAEMASIMMEDAVRKCNGDLESAEVELESLDIEPELSVDG